MNGQNEDGSIVTVSVICQKCHIGIFRARVEEWDTWRFTDISDAVDAWNRRAT